MKHELLNGAVTAAGKSVPAGVAAAVIAGFTLPDLAAAVGIVYTLTLLGCLIYDRIAKWRRRE